GDVETIIQRAREAHPGVTPRIISDNGPQFIAKDFKEFIRLAGMTHVKTSPYYPQSNGKIERWHKTLKGECIRVLVPLSLDDARRIVVAGKEHMERLNGSPSGRKGWLRLRSLPVPRGFAQWPGQLEVRGVPFAGTPNEEPVGTRAAGQEILLVVDQGRLESCLLGRVLRIAPLRRQRVE